MSATFMRIVVPLSFVLLFVVVSEAGILPHLVHIEITNRLNDEKDLTIHCYEREGQEELVNRASIIVALNGVVQISNGLICGHKEGIIRIAEFANGLLQIRKL
ncbi:hypothetical protein RYX36_004835, partial [Vicia faba]